MSDSDYSEIDDAQPMRKMGQRGKGKKPKSKPKKEKTESRDSSSTSSSTKESTKKKIAAKLAKVDPGYIEAMANSEEVEALDMVMQKASVIKADIAKLEGEISTVQTKINRLRVADTFEAADDLRDELKSAHALASKIRRDLAEFKDFKPDVENDGKKFKGSKEEAEGVVRMQRNLYVGLSQKFSSVLGEMTAVADSFQRVADKKPGQAFYSPGSDDEGSDDDDGFGGGGGLQQQKQKPQRSAQRDAEERAQRAYIYSKEVNKELHELEESIIQLHQLFVDISAQTAMQGELLGISEEAVRSASEQSSKALQVLQAAEQHVNAARKKFLAGVLIVIGVTILIIAGIGACIAILAMLG